MRGKKPRDRGDQLPALRAALISQVRAKYLDEVVELAATDPSTTGNRLSRVNQPGYVSSLVDQVHAARDAERQERPHCEDHPEEPFDTCRSCKADVKAGDRPATLIGKHFAPPLESSPGGHSSPPQTDLMRDVLPRIGTDVSDAA